MPTTKLSKPRKKKKRGFLDGYETYNPETEGYGNPDQWREAFRVRMGHEEAVQVLGDDDPYSILGITRTNDAEAIKKAYRKMALKWHPDRHPDSEKEAAAEEFKRVQAAYVKLGGK